MLSIHPCRCAFVNVSDVLTEGVLDCISLFIFLVFSFVVTVVVCNHFTLFDIYRCDVLCLFCVCCVFVVVECSLFLPSFVREWSGFMGWCGLCLTCDV